RAGRTARVRFTHPHCLTRGGACVSADGGRTWRWHAATLDPQLEGFDYTFAADGPVRFALAIPYTQADFDAWLTDHRPHPDLRVETLCTTEAGRAVELLRLGREVDDAPHRVAVIARQHCCESLASFELEGLMEAVLADDDAGRWLRDNVAWAVVPFMDKDGVEAGDQGKNRQPHDHNRDWVEGRYPSVRAVRELIADWSADDGVSLTLDLHCPWLRGEHNEDIYIVGSSNPAVWREQQAFAAHLERVNDSPLPYEAAKTLPHGQAWNVGGSAEPTSFGRWSANVAGAPLAATIEFPYALAGGATITADAARAFGRSVARAVREYLA
ncbi:MAG: M14 family zinc carboxypeptidase, partial [Phycisphaeraceae bacterium]